MGRRRITSKIRSGKDILDLLLYGYGGTRTPRKVPTRKVASRRIASRKVASPRGSARAGSPRTRSSRASSSQSGSTQVRSREVSRISRSSTSQRGRDADAYLKTIAVFERKTVFSRISRRTRISNPDLINLLPPNLPRRVEAYLRERPVFHTKLLVNFYNFLEELNHPILWVDIFRPKAN